jgi:hypothetical protein
MSRARRLLGNPLCRPVFVSLTLTSLPPEEYLLRHPFSLQKITWNATTQTVIYRSKRHYSTKRNFEIFKAPDFIAATLLHLPPKGQQTVRYYGTYSNKTRGQTPLIPDRIIRPPKPEPLPEKPPPAQILLIPAPPKQSAREMRPLWRDLILQTWGDDPLQCPCCGRRFENRMNRTV